MVSFRNLSAMALRPFIGIDYTTGKIDPFVESGAGAASLSVDKVKADRTDLMVGVDLRANPHSQISPYGQLVYRHNLDSQRRDITAFFNGNPASTFTVTGVSAKDDQIDLDAGVSFQASPALAIFAGYEGPFRKDLNNHGFSAGLSYSFGAAPPPPLPAPPPPLPLPPPATQTCPDGSVIEATATCPAPPPPPPRPLGRRGERG